MRHTVHRMVCASLLMAALSACRSTGRSELASGLEPAASASPDATAFEETILVGQSWPTNKLALLRVQIPREAATPANAGVQAQALSNTPVDVAVSGSQTSARTKHGRFYVAYDGGQILAIDSASGAVVYNQTVAEGPIFDIEIDGEAEAYVSFAKAPVIKRIDLRTGAVLATINLATEALAGVATLGARRLLLKDQTLYVGIDREGADSAGYLALIDRSSGAVRKVVALDTQERRARALMLPLVLDPFTGLLVIGAKGRRPSDTGLTILFDLRTEEVAERVVPSTFNGLWIFSEPYRMLLILDHTSTPVSSTHVMRSKIEADGTRTRIPRAMLDVFEESDELVLNGRQVLAMLPCACHVGGFCTRTKGLNFLDMEAGVKLPQLKVDAIGFEPEFAHFAKP